MIGSTNNTPISSLDLLPTFCELAQLTIPKEPELDGISIKSLLLGKNISRKRKPSFGRTTTLLMTPELRCDMDNGKFWQNSMKALSKN